jgi:hypothetical protein
MAAYMPCARRSHQGVHRMEGLEHATMHGEVHAAGTAREWPHASAWPAPCPVGTRMTCPSGRPPRCAPSASRRTAPPRRRTTRKVRCRPAAAATRAAGLHLTPYDPYEIRDTPYDIRSSQGDTAPYEPRLSPKRSTTYAIRCPSYGVWCNPWCVQDARFTCAKQPSPPVCALSPDYPARAHHRPPGTFKQQHDTGQNLKYVVVYPHVACASAPPAGAAGDGGGDGQAKR